MPTKANSKLARNAQRGIRGNNAPPKNRIRLSRMDSNNAVVRSRFIQYTGTTGAAIQITGGIPVAPALSGPVDAGGAVIRNYQEYKIRSAKLVYTPSVGSTTTGIMYIGYYDNPEIISRVYAGSITPSSLTVLAQTAPHSVATPVWQGCELVVPQRSRRKSYAVDSNVPGDSVTADLTVHGVFIFATVGAPFSTTIGVFSQEYVAEGIDLQNITYSGI